MESRNIMRCLALDVICVCVALAGLVITLLHLPIRIFKALTSEPDPPAPEPEVTIIVHEPAASFSTPKDTLLLIHGFPDSPRLYDSQVSYFTEKGYRCLLPEMPGCYGSQVSRSLDRFEAVDMICDALKSVHDGPVSVIGHDWGAVFAMQLEMKYPQLVRRTVTMDVGTLAGMKLNVIFAILAYQSVFALAYMVGYPGGSFMLRCMMHYFGYNVRPLNEVSLGMCHIYAGSIKTVLTETQKDKKSKAEEMKAILNIPHLFMYGKYKPFMFHADEWLKTVESTPSGEVHAMPSDHWIPARLPDDTNRVISQWLERTEQH